jgi:hypothetical protein
MRTTLKRMRATASGARSRGPAIVACALAVWPGATAGQTIRGVVFEEDTDIPVVGAQLEVLRADSTPERLVTSDRRGAFEVQVHLSGTYLLLASHLSYTGGGPARVEIGEHEVVTVILRMGRTAVPLEPLVVTARSADRLAGFYRRAGALRSGYFLTREDIERQRAAVASQLLSMTPGVWLSPADRGSILTMRGLGGRCPATVLLDGLPVAQELGMSIDEFTAPGLLEGVEIYPPNTPVPLDLPTYTNDCGVVAFWSRRSATRPLTLKRAIVAGAIAALILLSATVF